MEVIWHLVRGINIWVLALHLTPTHTLSHTQNKNNKKTKQERKVTFPSRYPLLPYQITWYSNPRVSLEEKPKYPDHSSLTKSSYLAGNWLLPYWARGKNCPGNGGRGWTQTWSGGWSLLAGAIKGLSLPGSKRKPSLAFRFSLFCFGNSWWNSLEISLCRDWVLKCNWHQN